MGSGDPPGLQNRRSSFTGDGVFDSHALPPLPFTAPLVEALPASAQERCYSSGAA